MWCVETTSHTHSTQLCESYADVDTLRCRARHYAYDNSHVCVYSAINIPISCARCGSQYSLTLNGVNGADRRISGEGFAEHVNVMWAQGPEELFETLSQCLLSGVDRDALSGWGAIVHVVYASIQIHIFPQCILRVASSLFEMSCTISCVPVHSA